MVAYSLGLVLDKSLCPKVRRPFQPPHVHNIWLYLGIGAAKSVGRIDHAAPLTTEAVAFSWPTPLGPLVPGLMGRLAVKSWSLGEVALLFSTTRPTSAAETVPFEGPTPRIVWGLVAVYAGLGLLFIALEIRSCRRLLRRHRESRILREHLQGTPAGMA
jgi:hypothetical protein